MLTIHKYPLEMTDEQYVDMPYQAVLLCVQLQRDVPCLWALVDTDRPVVTRPIYTVGTGHSVPQGSHRGQYVGTYQWLNGNLVFHVFG